MTPRVIETPLSPAMLSPKQMKACQTLFARGNLSFLLHSTQRKMQQTWKESGSDTFLILSSRQLGKTIFGMATAIEVCLKQPGSLVFYFGPTLKSLSDIVNDTLNFISLFAPPGLIVRQKTDMRWKIGKSELRLYPLERQHVDKARGKNAKGLIVIEEGCFVDSDSWNYAWTSVIDPLRLRHQPPVLINTTPPESETHSLLTDLLPKLEAINATARYTIYDNPFLTDEQIEKIKARVTPEAWAREYMAEITRSLTTTVIPEFSHYIVKKLTPPPYASWVMSIDQGGVKDPTGLTLLYHDHVTQRACVYRECKLPINTSLDEIIRSAKALEELKTQGPIMRFCDAPGQVHVEYSLKGYPLVQPTKGPGSFEASIQRLRVAINNGEFVVDESCTEVQRELTSGRYNRQRTDFERDSHGHLDLLASVLYGHNHIVKSNPTPPKADTFMATWKAASGVPNRNYQDDATYNELQKLWE